MPSEETMRFIEQIADHCCQCDGELKILDSSQYSSLDMNRHFRVLCDTCNFDVLHSVSLLQDKDVKAMSEFIKELRSKSFREKLKEYREEQKSKANNAMASLDLSDIL